MGIFVEPLPKSHCLFKKRPLSSVSIPGETVRIEEKVEISEYSLPPERKHIRVRWKNLDWFVFAEHCQIFDGGKKVWPEEVPSKVCLDLPYLSQLDNYENPTGSCNVTSMAMCFRYFGVERDPNYSRFSQLEDELYNVMLDCGRSRHSPQDLKWLAERYGIDDRFTVKATLQEVKTWLANGNPVVVHGYFTSFGHIIAIKGYDDVLQSFVVNDPYGEYFDSGYRTDLTGESLNYSYDLIRRTCMDDGDFWVHFLSK